MKALSRLAALLLVITALLTIAATAFATESPDETATTVAEEPAPHSRFRAGGPDHHPHRHRAAPRLDVPLHGADRDRPGRPGGGHHLRPVLHQGGAASGTESSRSDPPFTPGPGPARGAHRRHLSARRDVPHRGPGVGDDRAHQPCLRSRSRGHRARAPGSPRHPGHRAVGVGGAKRRQLLAHDRTGQSQARGAGRRRRARRQREQRPWPVG